MVSKVMMSHEKYWLVTTYKRRVDISEITHYPIVNPANNMAKVITANIFL